MKSSWIVREEGRQKEKREREKEKEKEAITIQEKKLTNKQNDTNKNMSKYLSDQVVVHAVHFDGLLEARVVRNHKRLIPHWVQRLRITK
jgi:hypothetical protein